jgi:hypothetical protein
MGDLPVLAPYGSKWTYSSLLEKTKKEQAKKEQARIDALRKEFADNNFKTLNFDEHNLYPDYDIRYCASRRSIPSKTVFTKDLDIGYMYATHKGTDPSPMRKFESKLFGGSEDNVPKLSLVDVMNLDPVNYLTRYRTSMLSGERWRQKVFMSNSYNGVNPNDIVRMFDDEFRPDTDDIAELHYMLPVDRNKQKKPKKYDRIDGLKHGKYWAERTSHETDGDTDSYSDGSLSDNEYYFDDHSSFDHFDDNMSKIDEENELDDDYDY